MTRFLIIAIAVAVVLTVYAVIDCAMTDVKRTRALSKPVWLLVILIVPIVGPVLWILFGKGLLLKSPAEAQQSAPDDDEAFLRSLGSDAEHADNIRRLEAELAALDEQFTVDGSAGPVADQSRLDDLDPDEAGSPVDVIDPDEGVVDGDAPSADDRSGDDDHDDRTENGEPRTHSDAQRDVDGDAHGHGTARA